GPRAAAPAPGILARHSDTDREVIGGNEVRIVRSDSVGHQPAVSDGHRPSYDTPASATDDAPSSRALFVPDEWRDEYSNRS
ncbi:MAG: hypothetical protein ACRDT4_16040, partial [Micromonosporaceae bacterium]